MAEPHTDSSPESKYAQDTAAPARASIDVLGRAVEFVGDYFGTEPVCGNAAALMCEIGRGLGYTLVPRPVSLLARSHSTGISMIIGPKAAEKWGQASIEKAEVLGTADPNNGHVVVTNENPPLLIDANVRQLARGGLEVPSIMASINSVRPDKQEWNLRPTNDVELWYFLDEGNRSLIDGLDEVAASYAPEAAHFAKLLLDGAPAGFIIEQLRRIPGYFEPGTGPDS